MVALLVCSIVLLARNLAYKCCCTNVVPKVLTQCGLTEFFSIHARKYTVFKLNMGLMAINLFVEVPSENRTVLESTEYQKTDNIKILCCSE